MSTEINREVMNGLLTKLGVENAGKLSTERAEKKLRKRLEAQGVPQEMSADETLLCASMGFTAAGQSAPTAPDETQGKVPAPFAGEKEGAPVEAPKAKKAGGAKPRENSGMHAFKKAFEGNESHIRSELIETIAKLGSCSKWSVMNYIAAAKKEGNVFGFQLTEAKNEAGQKILTKVG